MCIVPVETTGSHEDDDDVVMYLKHDLQTLIVQIMYSVCHVTLLLLLVCVSCIRLLIKSSWKAVCCLTWSADLFLIADSSLIDQSGRCHMFPQASAVLKYSTEWRCWAALIGSEESVIVWHLGVKLRSQHLGIHLFTSVLMLGWIDTTSSYCFVLLQRLI